MHCFWGVLWHWCIAFFSVVQTTCYCQWSTLVNNNRLNFRSVVWTNQRTNGRNVRNNDTLDVQEFFWVLVFQSKWRWRKSLFHTPVNFCCRINTKETSMQRWAVRATRQRKSVCNKSGTFPVLELTMKELLNNIRCPGGLRSLTVTRLQQDVARLLLLIVAACSQTFSAHNRSVLSHVYTYLDAYLCM